MLTSSWTRTTDIGVITIGAFTITPTGIIVTIVILSIVFTCWVIQIKTFPFTIVWVKHTFVGTDVVPMFLGNCVFTTLYVSIRWLLYFQLRDKGEEGSAQTSPGFTCGLVPPTSTLVPGSARHTIPSLAPPFPLVVMIAGSVLSSMFRFIRGGSLPSNFRLPTWATRWAAALGGEPTSSAPVLRSGPGRGCDCF